MNSEIFEIKCRKSQGNLHVHPRGDLDVQSVRKLLKLIHDEYDGLGLVFVDTKDLGDCDAGSVSVFKAAIESSPAVSPSCVVFKGEKGIDIAPCGSRVLIAPKRGCCGGNGNCGQCACHSGPLRKRSCAND